MSFQPSREGHVLVIGAAGTDIIGRAAASLHSGTSNPGQVRMCYGGVARNVAENLVRLGTETILITAVGDDEAGQQLLSHASSAGIVTECAMVAAGMPTSAYLAVLDDRGALHFALDDMSAIEAITPAYLREHRSLFADAAAVMVDANLPPRSLATAVSMAKRAGVPICADPTSLSLAKRLEPHLPDLWLITPNEAEAGALCPQPVPHADRVQATNAARHLVAQGVAVAIITMAEFGVAYATADSSGHIPAVQTEIIDPTGAGDALTAALIFALLNEIPLDEAARLGVSAASLTLRTTGSVVPDLSLELLYDQLR